VNTKALTTSALITILATVLIGFQIIGCSPNSNDKAKASRQQVAKEDSSTKTGFLNQIQDEQKDRESEKPQASTSQSQPQTIPVQQPAQPAATPESGVAYNTKKPLINGPESNTDQSQPAGSTRTTGSRNQSKSETDSTYTPPFSSGDAISGPAAGVRGGRGASGGGGRGGTPSGSMGGMGGGFAGGAARETSGGRGAAADGIVGGRGGRGSSSTSTTTTTTTTTRTTTNQLSADLLAVSADEIWIIAKPKVARPVATYDTPGCGAMMAKLPQEQKEVPLPLKHTDVKGQISGYIATVEVTQQFHNPYGVKIEASYVFPLPDNAAVNEFIMIIGERKIRGIIRERQEAEQIYEAARSQGYVASLLTEERPNIFTQKVANIEPNKEIDVTIKYFNTMAYVDGWYEFVFPMVVGPRFNPPSTSDGVGAVAMGKTNASGQSTEVQYLNPSQRSGHDISLAVDIDAGVAIEELTCPSHAITNSSTSAQKRTIKLNSLDSIPNKDFVLRYKVAGKTLKSALVTHSDQRGGFFTLMLYPPESITSLKRSAMEMIFVMDCSGSMSGEPIAKAKDAVTRALKQLQNGDTFQIIRFSNESSQFGPAPVPATPDNIRRGLQYVDSLQSDGGTMMIEGVKSALDFPHDTSRFRLVSFLTDGYIGNETEILEAIQQKLGSSRIFSFGVGSSVNRYLLDRMAKLGKGAVAYVGLDENAGEIIDLFYERISHPALTDVKIDWGGLQVSDVYPNNVPDMFVGRPVIITGKFKSQKNTTIRVSGRIGNLDDEIAIPVTIGETAATHPGIACVWARKQIETLANQATYDKDSELPVRIRQVALEYGLMSAYTAFIAVDSSQQTAGTYGVTVPVAVPVPDGVRYDTTVQR
jgi:Ca-activated chloride channel homolog